MARWEHEAGALQLLDDLKERLIDGQLTNQKEIADLYGYSPTTARNWIDKGNGRAVSKDCAGCTGQRRTAKGEQQTALCPQRISGVLSGRDGKTEAPVKPDYSWKDETLDEALPDDVL